jgi:hypothetical protein
MPWNCSVSIGVITCSKYASTILSTDPCGPLRIAARQSTGKHCSLVIVPASIGHRAIYGVNLRSIIPQAKVILTARDAEQWYDSVMRTIYPSSQAMRTDDDPQRREAGEWVNTIIWQQVFDGRMNDRAHAISVYNTHVASVRAGIASERLLVFEPQSGWAPLCEFLQCPLPDTPYPLVNTTEEFLARRHAQVKPAT